MYGENGNPSSMEKFRPFVYWRDSGQSTEDVYEQVRLSASAGVGGFIPIPVNNKELTPEDKFERICIRASASRLMRYGMVSITVRSATS